MFCQWSSVSTISRTTLWQWYDKERLSIHCQKVSSKTKHFARYVLSVWLEGHSFLLSYWLSMSVSTIPTLIYFDFNAIEAHPLKVFEIVFFNKSSCAFGLLFLRSYRAHVKFQVMPCEQSSFQRKSILHGRLVFYAMFALRKAEKSSQAQARWLNKRENKNFLVWQQQIRIAC